MSSEQLNIVQAEFFHTPFSSLEDLSTDITERILDGSPIKTVVRFLDEDGALTNLVQQLERLEQRYTESVLDFSEKSMLKRAIHNRRIKSLHRKIVLLRESKQSAVLDRFTKAIQSYCPIAVEQNDHSFRSMRNEEKLDLLAAAKHSTGLWVFIFYPNGILADENEMITHSM